MNDTNGYIRSICIFHCTVTYTGLSYHDVHNSYIRFQPAFIVQRDIVLIWRFGGARTTARINILVHRGVPVLKVSDTKTPNGWVAVQRPTI